MKRFLFSGNGTLTDYSVEVDEFSSGSAGVQVVSAEDAIFIGSVFPFNSLYMKVGTANSNASAVTVSYWDGTQFREMVDVLDETSSGGVAFSNSGHVTWTPGKNNVWAREDTVSNTGGEEITGLGSVTIYDLYWVKLTYSAGFSASTALSWVGPMFCNDQDLYGEYSFFADTSFKSGFESGKTDWEEQRVIASRLMVEDLENKSVVFSGDQLLERRKMRLACVSKTAQVIFNNLGDDYRDDVKSSREEYYKRLAKQNYSADKNNDGRLNVYEKKVGIGGSLDNLFDQLRTDIPTYSGFSTKIELSNPYSLDDNPETYLKDSWGIRLDSGDASPLSYDYQLTTERTITAILARRVVDSHGVNRNINEEAKSLFLDAKTLRDNFLDLSKFGILETGESVVYNGDSGINFLNTGKFKVIFTEIDFLFEIVESINQ